MHHHPKGDPNWSHEDASLMLLDELFKELGVHSWGSELAQKIAEKNCAEKKDEKKDGEKRTLKKSLSDKENKFNRGEKILSDAEKNYPEIYKEFDLDENDMKFIKKMVDPPKKEMLKALKEGNLTEKWSGFDMGRGIDDLWMFQIVSDWINGLDVDRIDYFARDAFHLFG
jgi:hypothetical protein